MLTISSGPRLMSDRTHFEKSMTDMPGEGKTFSSKEQGTKIWRNKTHRKYYEPVIKPNRDNRRNTDLKAIDYMSDRSDDIRSHHSHRSQRPFAVTDDQKIVSAEDLDKIFLERDPKGFVELQNSESYSYIPTVRDVGIQCNRKKTNRHLSKTSSDNDSYVRVIKSSDDGFVTAYSDVPQLKNSRSQRTPVSKHEVWGKTPQNEAIYSKVDKSKKKFLKDDINEHYGYEDINNNYPTIIYKTPVNLERRAPSGLSQYSKYSGSEYSTNTNRTLKNKTKGIGFTLSSGVDGPDVKLPTTSPKLRSRSLNRYEEPRHDWNVSLNDSLPRNNYKKEVKQEVLEETISISNASSDDLQPYEDRSFDELLEPKPHFRELESKRREISYVNELPNPRRLKDREDSPGMRSRTLQDYRRGINGVTYVTDTESPYSSLSRYDSKKKDSKPTDFTPPPRQAFTLDRRLLKERQKRLEETKNKEIPNSRLNKSTVDLTEHSRNDDLRGGLATAYRNRQLEKRTSSLNRMSAIREGRASPSHSVPIRYLSHNQLNSAGNSANSSSDSDTLNRHKRHYIHDREPIVMYIPAVSHHNKRADDEADRLSSILRPNSRTGSTTSSRKGKKLPKSSASSDITPTKPRLQYSTTKYSNYGTNGTNRPANDEELDQIVELKDTKNFGKLNKKGKSILSRRHSIPKDTKFPWLQKLKSKVKFRE